MSGFIYLASPYSHKDVEVRNSRFRAAVSAANYLMDTGLIVYSPIVHFHTIDEMHPNKSRDHDFWMRQCVGMLRQSSKLIVFALDGWKESRGVSQEILISRTLGIHVGFLSPAEF